MLLNKLRTAGRNAFGRLIVAREREAARRIAEIRASRGEL